VNLGMSIGPALGGIIAQWSFPAIFVVDGLTTLVAGAILAYAGFQVAASPHPVDIRRTFLPIRALKDRTLQIFLLGMLPVLIVFFQHVGAMPLFMTRELGMEPQIYGLMFTINTGLVVAFEIPLNTVTSHWPAKKSMILGTVLFALGFGGMAIAHSILQLALTVLIWTFGEIILFPALSAFVSEIAPASRRGEYMGLYTMTFSIAFMAAPWTGIQIMSHYGSTTLWAICGFIALLSVYPLGFQAAPRQNIPC
jgi:MFS family permease